MPNRKESIRDKNETDIWNLLQKAIKKIKEQDRIIKALSLYAIKNEKMQDLQAAKRKGEKWYSRIKILSLLPKAKGSRKET